MTFPVSGLLQLNKYLPLCACVSAEEVFAFFDRLALVRKCEQVAGSEMTTRTNVLLVRQYLLSPGNGVVFTYTSQKNTKKSHHQGKSERFSEIEDITHFLEWMQLISELSPTLEPIAT